MVINMLKYLKIILLVIFIYSLSSTFGELIIIHNNTMNITNSTGGSYYNVNDTLTFKALAPEGDTLAKIILENGTIKWDFGDLTETDYGNYTISYHKYNFPFIYPVSWCGYLNNTGYPKVATYNWIVVGNPYTTKYNFIGNPSYSKDNWEIEYNSTNNTVIIKYYFDKNVNYTFLGVYVDNTPVDVNVSRDNIVEGDAVEFSYTVPKNIIFQLWDFGDGTFSFEKSPTHVYNKPGIYYPRVLLVDDSGRILVGYYDKGIIVNKPRGGYFEPIRDMNYVKNSTGAVNVLDEYAMAYKVGDKIYFNPDAYYYDYVKYFFGDGTETNYLKYYYRYEYSHVYKYPFIYPICWMDVNRFGDYSIASSATLDYLVVGDVGDTIYNFIPNSENKEKPTVYYDAKNHIVNISFYSENINNTVTLKLKQKVHYDVQVLTKETPYGIEYSFIYPYGKPVFVYWSFGDGTHSLENSPIHEYPNNGIDYKAHVLIIDENGVVSVGFGPVVKNNRIESSMLYINPTIVEVNQPFNITYINKGAEYLDLYFLDYTLNNYITSEIENYLNPEPDYTGSNFVTYYVGNKEILSITCKIPWEGIYYIKGYDFTDHDNWLYNNYRIYFIPRMIKVIDNRKPVAKLYVYPNPASYIENIFFNPMNSYDPDANRVLENSGGYIISPDEPYARIYGFNLTVYNSSGAIVWNYTSNKLVIVTHKFPPGDYIANLTVWDGFGAKDSVIVKFKVINYPPVADFTYSPNIPKVNETVTFNALKSYDKEGEIVRYVWNFGDNNTEITTSPIITHIYNKPGIYKVTLTVYDKYNLSDTISKNISVYYIRAVFDSPTKANPGEEIKFIDKSISIPGEIVRYVWDFGDGTFSFEKSPTHVYNKPGIYKVTLTVWNNVGLSDSYTKEIFIGNVVKYPPVADFTFSINGTKVIFNASKSYDIDGKIVKYVWDFGDGSIVETTSPIITHIYNKPGIYKVTLTVYDNDNYADSTIRFVKIYKSEKSVPVPLYIHILTIVITIISIRLIFKK